MPQYYERGPDGRIVMICQVCGTRCHGDGPKRVHILDKLASAREARPVYRTAECPMCVCHECVQLADDPLRSNLAPRMLGQTFDAPFNIGRAISDMHGLLGLREPERRALPGRASPTPCLCGKQAKSRCIQCNEALCGKCSGTHRC